MSSRRTTLGSVRRLVPTDPELRAVAVVVTGTLFALGAVVFGSFVSFGGALTATLYPLAVLFPVLGLVIVAGTLWWAMVAERSTVPSMFDGAPPESAVTRAEEPVGRKTDRTLNRAALGRYRCRTTDANADVRTRLVEGAVRVSTASQGLDAAAAQEWVRSGTWTDDPVAAAFLADEVRQPVPERLRGIPDPGAAYHRRVRRTLDAIESARRGARRIDPGGSMGADGDASTIADGNGSAVATEADRRSEQRRIGERHEGRRTNADGGGSTNAPRVDRLDHVEWGLVGALSLAGIGIAVGSQLLVAAATVPLTYVAAAVLGTRPNGSVVIERRFDVSDSPEGVGTTDGAGDGRIGGGSDGASAADPPADRDRGVHSGKSGDAVSVRTTVRNVGPEPIVDLRVVDGVPDALPVVSGSPRACDTLEPGASLTLEYAVELRRGEHAFDDATVRTRDLTGTVVETRTASVDGDDAITCVPAVDEVPLGGGTNDYAGEVPTDEGGSGVEFYAVREYERGDPVGSIDWRRYARTRELATVEYRAERATRLVCVVDGRPSQFRAATRDRTPAVELSVVAAERTIDWLQEAGHPTGLVAVDDGRLGTVPTGTDPATKRRAIDLLEATRRSGRLSGDDVRHGNGDLGEELPRTLPGEAQVFLFSSFVDDEPVELVELLRARGYSVRVISPAVTAGADDLPTRLEGLDRENRLAHVRTTGARVVDWHPERPLVRVLADALREVGDR